MGEAEKAAFRIGDIHMHAATQRFVHNETGVRIERIKGVDRLGEKFLIDRVFTFDRKKRDATKLQLLIEADCIVIIVQHRQIDMVKPSRLKMLGQFANQLLTNAGLACLRMHCQTPERTALIRIIEQALVIDAGDCPDNFARRIILRDEIGDGTVIAF